MLIRPVELAEYEQEKSEILCGFSISSINLINGLILLLTSCVNCSALGWWMVNYFSITVVFSNIVGVLFFGRRIRAEGYESLDFLSEQYDHLLYFRPIELGFFVALTIINLLLLPLMYFVQLIRSKQESVDASVIPNPHLVVTSNRQQQQHQHQQRQQRRHKRQVSWI